MDWRMSSIGLVVDVSAVLLPGLLTEAGLPWWETDYAILLGALLLTGLVFTVTGLVKTGPTSYFSASGLMLASVLVGVYTLASIFGVWISYDSDAVACDLGGAPIRCDRATSILGIVWLMWGTLFIPILTFLGATLLRRRYDSKSPPLVMAPKL